MHTENFDIKLSWDCVLETCPPELHLILVISPKYFQCIQEALLEIGYFTRELSKIF